MAGCALNCLFDCFITNLRFAQCFSFLLFSILHRLFALHNFLTHISHVEDLTPTIRAIFNNFKYESENGANSYASISEQRSLFYRWCEYSCALHNSHCFIIIIFFFTVFFFAFDRNNRFSKISFDLNPVDV